MALWSKSQWQRHIRMALSAPERIVFTNHALQQMRARRVTRSEAMDVLKKGIIRREPEPNLRRGTLECRLEYYVAGRDLALVAAVDSGNPAVVVVTVIDLDRE